MEMFKKIFKNTFGIIMMLSCVWLAKMMAIDCPKSEKSVIDFMCSEPFSFVLAMIIILGIVGSLRDED